MLWLNSTGSDSLLRCLVLEERGVERCRGCSGELPPAAAGGWVMGAGRGPGLTRNLADAAGQQSGQARPAAGADRQRAVAPPFHLHPPHASAEDQFQRCAGSTVIRCPCFSSAASPSTPACPPAYCAAVGHRDQELLSTDVLPSGRAGSSRCGGSAGSKPLRMCSRRPP